jgi:transposase
MICDQYGGIPHYDVCSGGTTKVDIVQFLKEARDKLPQAENQIKPKNSLLFLDHLNSHVSLQKAGMKGWDLQLTPVTCPDANVIEYIFSSIKAYLRKVSVKKDTMKVTPWIQYVKEQIMVWYRAYKANSGIFNHCREFVDDLIQSGGDVQLAKLKKIGFKSIKESQNSISFDDIG